MPDRSHQNFHLHDTPVTLAVIATKLDGFGDRLKSVEEKLDEKFVTVEAFTPVRNAVYGAVAAIGTAFLLGLAALLHYSGK